MALPKWRKEIMGKIRVKVIGEDEAPKKKKSYEERKAEKRAEESVQETVVETAAPVEEAVVSEEEDEVAEKVETKTPEKTPVVKEVKTESKSEEKVHKKAAKKVLSKKYSSNSSLVDKNKTYKLDDAVKILKGFKGSKFDETVELHLNVKEEGISGTLSLPHGTGKEVRVKVADDALIEQIEKGKIDFDVLIASPSLMPKLARVAKVLGPRGLMPNPKNGTVTDDPKPLMEKLSKGQIRFKTEAKAPVIHLSVGKVSFDADKLSENITTVLTSVGANKITKVTLKSTMSPGIKVSL